MRGLSAQLALCLLLGAVVACTASVDSKVWFPENPGLEFIPGKTSVAVIGARNLGKTAVNVSAAWAQLALVSNAEGSIYNFSAAAYQVPALSTSEELIVEYSMLMPINLPPRDFILRILLWTTTSLNEQDTIVLFNDTISIIEEPRIVDTELLGLYVILLACFTAAAYGALTFAQGKGWVKKPRKSKTAPAVASGDKSEWLKGTVADKSSKKTVKQTIKWLDFRNRRNDVLAMGKVLKDIHRVTILKVGPRELYRKNCMYLCNHRSWADFLVDQYVTEGRTLFVGRWAVAAAFPLVMLPLRAIRCAILFKRGHIADIEGFNNWIDIQFAKSPQTGVGVYPEGHRSTHGESLPLKRGMLKYAYTRKLPVQIVIGGNKESILSEKHFTARFHQTVAVGFSEVLKPEEYPDFEPFMQKIQETWDNEWNEVFSSNWEVLPVIPEVTDPQLDYPMDIRIIMAICAVIIILLAAMVAWLTWRAVAAVTLLLGSLKWPVAGLFGLYVVASFYFYSQADNARLIHQKMFHQRKQAPKVAATAAAEEENGNKKEQ